MCGIAGFVSQKPFLSEKVLCAMRDAVVHRGPDDQGVKIWSQNARPCSAGENGTVGLAHTRLSIIDLSDAGHQPMSNEDGSVWITYNGEFYNFGKYRQELEQAGHVFSSNTDTEVIIHLYEEYGIEETLKRMNGMFAFGLWDKKRDLMILARDRLGKKPLHYTLLPDGTLAFASEIKSLLAAKLVDTHKVDLSAFVQFWTFGYAAGALTTYEQVRRIPPGNYAIWCNGRLVVKEYWDCPFGVDVRTDAKPDDLADELESLLINAISERLIADVPVGLFLSGGIDSSLISALTAKLTNSSIKTYTVAFEEDRFNEAPYAKAVADHIGLENVALPVSQDMRSHFEKIALHFDEPFGDSSAIPTYFVSKAARKHVAVVLTGDAGDELFAGYNAYWKGLQLWGDSQQRTEFGRRVSWQAKLRDLPFRLLTKPSSRLTDLERQVSTRQMKHLLSDYALDAIRDTDVYKTREDWYERVKDADFLSQMQYANLKTYLPDDILVKVDRMSMAHALECRSPLLDYRIVEFASKLPYSQKIDSDGRQKAILRRLLSRFVPDKLTNRPKKGFAIPWADWCRGDLEADLKKRWQKTTSPLLRPAAAERIFPKDGQRHPGLLWNAFCALTYLEKA